MLPQLKNQPSEQAKEDTIILSPFLHPNGNIMENKYCKTYVVHLLMLGNEV